MAKTRDAYGVSNPLQPVFPLPVIAKRQPTTRDTKYELGQLWVDKETSRVFALARSALGAASWILLGTGTGDLETLEGDTGGTIFPVAGNINIKGGLGVTVTGLGNTLTIDELGGGFPISSFIVGLVGEAKYQTIQSAINAAAGFGGKTVYVQPGTYTENLILEPEVDIAGAINTGVIINGEHTPPSSGRCTFQNVTFTTPTSIIKTAGAGSADLLIHNCLGTVDSGFIYDLPLWTGDLSITDSHILGTTNRIVNNTAGAFVEFIGCQLGAGTSNATISGNFSLQSTELGCGVALQGSADMQAHLGCLFVDTITTSGSASANFSECEFLTVANSALNHGSTGDIEIYNSSIFSNATDTLDGSGAGTLTLTGIDFTRSAGIASTLTVATGESKTGTITLLEAGNHLEVKGGSPLAFIGQAKLVAGTVSVANTSLLSTDRILLSRGSVSTSTALGSLSAGITAGPALSIQSIQSANPVALETGDISFVNYFIVREIP